MLEHRCFTIFSLLLLFVIQTGGMEEEVHTDTLHSSDSSLTDSNIDRIEQHGETSTVGAKIFVLAPNGFRSHFNLFQRLVEILKEQEWVQHIHLLVVEFTSLSRQPTDLRTGGKLFVQHYNPHESRGGEQRRITNNDGAEWNPRDYEKNMKSSTGANSNQFFNLAADKALMIKLWKQNFDFGIAELWDYGALHILWLLGVKHFVATQSMPLESIYYHYLGYLDKIIHKGDIPELWTAKYGDHEIPTTSAAFKISHERKADLYKKEHEKMSKIYAKILSTNYKMNAEVVVPTYSQLFAKIRRIFVNTQPFLDFEMPPGYPAKVVNIGGIHLDNQRQHGAINNQAASSSAPNQDIESKAIQASRSAHKQGLILISFGSVVSMEKIPDEAFNRFLALFAIYPEYEFLWKFESPKLAHYYKLRKHKNVHIKAWLNQIAILGNPQTKLFISHCGINSVIEAVHYAVPLLCVPFQSEQFYTSEALARRNVAVVVDKDNLGDLMEKMGLALQDMYKDRMLEMRELLIGSQRAEKFTDEMRNMWNTKL